MPWTSFGLVVAGLSLIGVPGTAGFISKWYLILAALEKGQWWLVFLIVGSSLLAVIYVWRFVEAAYFREPRQDLPPAPAVPWGMRIPCVVLVVATVWLGLDTRFSAVPAAEAAAAMMARSH
jgi:multicomponent Na+:H+ antiporter subunit D